LFSNAAAQARCIELLEVGAFIIPEIAEGCMVTIMIFLSFFSKPGYYQL
jgi:hypothetical protein